VGRVSWAVLYSWPGLTQIAAGSATVTSVVNRPGLAITARVDPPAPWEWPMAATFVVSSFW
jgi:hypothetical protein